MKIKVSASVLSADFGCLRKDIERAERAGVDMFHIDVMDGHLAPNITIGTPIVFAIRKATKLPLDAHLMIDNPGIYIEDFIAAGADIITLHAEAYSKNIPNVRNIKKLPRKTSFVNEASLLKDAAEIRRLGAKPSICINPSTGVGVIEKFLDKFDKVLVMSVNPGFSGQKFMPSCIAKIKRLRKIYGKDIEVDGGINDLSSPSVLEAGANILVSASYIFKAQDMPGAIRKLKGIR